jgi:hypothetical protein
MGNRIRTLLMTKEKNILQLVRVAFVSQLLLEEIDELSDLTIFKQDFKMQTNKFVKSIMNKLGPMIRSIYDADEEAITAFQNEMDKNVQIVIEKLLKEVKN